jgi:hypothetical protein
LSDKVKRETAKDRKRRQIGEFHDALLGSPNMVEACKVAGISPRTGARWIRTDVFAEVYSEKRKATLEACSGLLKAGSIGAISAPVEVIQHQDSPATAKTQAASKLIDAMLKITELRELEERLAKLEAAQRSLLDE